MIGGTTQCLGWRNGRLNVDVPQHRLQLLKKCSRKYSLLPTAKAGIRDVTSDTEDLTHPPSASYATQWNRNTHLVTPWRNGPLFVAASAALLWTTAGLSPTVTPVVQAAEVTNNAPATGKYVLLQRERIEAIVLREFAAGLQDLNDDQLTDLLEDVLRDRSAASAPELWDRTRRPHGSGDEVSAPVLLGPVPQDPGPRGRSLAEAAPEQAPVSARGSTSYGAEVVQAAQPQASSSPNPGARDSPGPSPGSPSSSPGPPGYQPFVSGAGSQPSVSGSLNAGVDTPQSQGLAAQTHRSGVGSTQADAAREEAALALEPAGPSPSAVDAGEAPSGQSKLLAASEDEEEDYTMKLLMQQRLLPATLDIMGQEGNDRVTEPGGLEAEASGSSAGGAESLADRLRSWLESLPLGARQQQQPELSELGMDQEQGGMMEALVSRVASLRALLDVQLRPPSLPALSLPDLPALPSLPLPAFSPPTLPSLDLSALGVPTLPPLPFPPLDLPALPSVSLPALSPPTLPSVPLPTWSPPGLPSVPLPAFSPPSLPSLDLAAGLPSGLRSLVQGLEDRRGGLALPAGLSLAAVTLVGLAVQRARAGDRSSRGSRKDADVGQGRSSSWMGRLPFPGSLQQPARRDEVQWPRKQPRQGGGKGSGAGAADGTGGSADLREGGSVRPPVRVTPSGGSKTVQPITSGPAGPAAPPLEWLRRLVEALPVSPWRRGPSGGGPDAAGPPAAASGSASRGAAASGAASRALPTGPQPAASVDGEASTGPSRQQADPRLQWLMDNGPSLDVQLGGPQLGVPDVELSARKVATGSGVVEVAPAGDTSSTKATGAVLWTRREPEDGREAASAATSSLVSGPILWRRNGDSGPERMIKGGGGGASAVGAGALYPSGSEVASAVGSEGSAAATAAAAATVAAGTPGAAARAGTSEGGTAARPPDDTPPDPWRAVTSPWPQPAMSGPGTEMQPGLADMARSGVVRPPLQTVPGGGSGSPPAAPEARGGLPWDLPR